MSGYTILKVGGSLIPTHIEAVCGALKRATHHRKLVLIAGGGEIADVIRGYRRKLDVSDATTFAMALLSMDQHAFLLAELGGFPLARTVGDLALISEPICVLAPAMDVHGNSLGRSVDIGRVTSDAVAAFIAARIGASLVIATDVDGIYDQDPRLAPDAALLEQVKAGDLKHPTSIDVEAAAAIQRFGLDATVLNGAKPQLLADHLAGIEVRRTKVLA